jgi:hypothetical protein
MNKKKMKFAKISLIKFTHFNRIIIGKFLKSLYKNNKNLHKSSNIIEEQSKKKKYKF